MRSIKKESMEAVAIDQLFMPGNSLLTNHLETGQLRPTSIDQLVVFGMAFGQHDPTAPIKKGNHYACAPRRQGSYLIRLYDRASENRR